MEIVKEYCPECGRGEWVGLTMAEVADAYAHISNAKAPFSQFAELLEAKLKEKNANPIN